jgi:AcrR family transcriptional regulator
MAWDIEGTKRALLEAAVEEFAEHGFAGGRVNRVAARARVNKERLYEYFGSKAELFELVLQRELAGVAAAVPLHVDESGGLDLGSYAGRVFDYHRERPHLLRLLHWEGLEPTVEGMETGRRAELYTEKIEAIRQAQHSGSVNADVDAGSLLYAVLALAAWRFAVPQTTRSMLGTHGDDVAIQRAALVELAGRLARPDQRVRPVTPLLSPYGRREDGYRQHMTDTSHDGEHLNTDQDAEPPTSDGLEPDADQLEPGSEPASDPDPEPGASASDA